MRITKRQLRRIIREAEGSDIKNIGHLKDALAAAKGKKRANQGKDALKDLGKGFLADLIPGGGTMSSIYDLLKTTYTMDDDKRTGTALDYLDVDDEVSAIVDDPIENKFLKVLANKIEGMPNEMSLEDFDMTKLLSDYIKGDFEGRTITGFTEGKTVKIAKSELRRIIREAIDVVNPESGEVFEFGPEGLPDEAWPDLQRRLGITPLDPSPDADVAYATDPGSIEVSSEDFYKLEDEVEGKRWKRKRTADERRLNPVTLRDRLDKWAEDAGSDYAADNPGVDMQDIARDLAASAEYQFEQDEWDALIDDFDYDEDALLSYIADTVVG